jgi:hypothetical protein
MDERKPTLLTIKITPERLEEFRIAATLRGTTMSSLVSQFVAEVITEEKARVPEAFRRRNWRESSLVDYIKNKPDDSLN